MSRVIWRGEGQLAVYFYTSEKGVGEGIRLERKFMHEMGLKTD